MAKAETDRRGKLGNKELHQLLSRFEKMRVRDALRSSLADDFIRAAARFTTAGGNKISRDGVRA